MVTQAPVKTFPVHGSNLGPIKHVALELPQSGVAVFKGRSGSGKSTLLRGIEAVVSEKRPDITVHDKELHGELDCFGVELRFGRKISRSGEPEVHGIMGLDIGEFIDPKLKDVGAADAARIRALVRLSGRTADPALFYDLVGGQEAFDAILPNVAVDEDDLLRLAKRIKAGFETAARKAESAADQERGHAQACAEAAKQVDLTAESDPVVLQRTLEGALEQKTKLEQQAIAAVRAKGRYDTAVKNLSAAQAEMMSQPTVEETRGREEIATKAAIDSADEVSQARAALKAAESKSQLANQELSAAAAARSAAETRAKVMASWEQAIQDGAGHPMPSEEELESVAGRASTARMAVETGALIRKARVSQQESEQHLLFAQKWEKTGQDLRSAADSVDKVLSGVVSRMGGLVRVESDRLVCDTARGKTYVAELSDGERCRIGMRLFLDRLGTRESESLPKGVMTLQQSFWGELQPSVQAEIDAEAIAEGVLVITAQATDDEEISVDRVTAV
jgi:energy-coupling factor transporter ATP-binding protein EcfA2